MGRGLLCPGGVSVRARGGQGPCQGIVLAGGKSRRFGSNKALALVRGESLLGRAVRLLQDIGLPAVVIAGQPGDYAWLTCPVLADLIPGRGPLGGLQTALAAFPGKRLLVLTCDMPNLQTDPLQELLEHSHPESLATLFILNQKRRQPFPGLYGPDLASYVHTLLSQGDASMQRLLSGLPRLQEIENRFNPVQFVNVNRKEDMNQIL